MQRHDVASTLSRRCINVMCPLGCTIRHSKHTRPLCAMGRLCYVCGTASISSLLLIYSVFGASGMLYFLIMVYPWCLYILLMLSNDPFFLKDTVSDALAVEIYNVQLCFFFCLFVSFCLFCFCFL